MLGFLPFVLIPEYFSLWNLAKMNVKDSWTGQPVDCLQKCIRILIVDFKDQRAEMFLSLPSVSLHQCWGTSSIGANCRTTGRSVYVAPRLLFCYTLEGELEVKVTDFSKQAWILKSFTLLTLALLLPSSCDCNHDLGRRITAPVILQMVDTQANRKCA